MAGPSSPARAAYGQRPATPRRLAWLDSMKDVNSALDRLGKEAGLKFPSREDREPPNSWNKNPLYEAKHSFSQLFYVSRDLLKSAVQDFMDWVPILSDQDEKLDLLLKKLRIATQTYSTSARKPRVIGPLQDQKQEPASPPASPTLAAKHNPHSSYEAVEGIDMAPPVLQPNVPSNNTSFASTSFWSNAPGGSQGSAAPITANTSFATLPYDPADDLPASPPKESTVARVLFKTPTQERRLETSADNIERQHPASTPNGQEDGSVYPWMSPRPELAAVPSEDIPPIVLDGVNDHAPPASDYGSLSWEHGIEDQPAPSALGSGQIEEWREGVNAPPEDPTTLIDDIPSIGFEAMKLPPSFHRLRFDLQWECYRFLQTQKMTPEEFDTAWTEQRTMISLHKFIKERQIPFQFGMKVENFTNITLYTKLRWTKPPHKTVFYLQLLPLKKEKSNAFEREFGADRILYVDVPSLNYPPESMQLGSLGDRIRKSVQAMVRRDIPFLSRTWRQFHVEPKDPTERDPDFAKAGVVQFTFFAVRGNDITEVSVAKLLNWAVPFHQNGYQPSCKAYSRLGLAASRGRPTIVLRRSQIEMVDDILPDDTSDDCTHNDPKPEFVFHPTRKSKEVMNDGCNWISQWAMAKIATILEIDYIPSVIQARVFGAKGLWYVGQDDASIESEIALRISKSQLKVVQDENENYGPEKFTINVVAWSRPAQPTKLAVDQLPILIDRGVSRDTIGGMVLQQADAGHQELLSSLLNRHDFRLWISKQNGAWEERHRDEGIDELGDFPKSREEKLVRMCEVGFEPSKCYFAADEARNLSKQMLSPENKAIKITINCTTMPYGIADPFGVLNPGEVHLCFSEPFRDPLSKNTWNTLHNLDGLVSRFPVLAPWDIQRVRFVFKPELAHIRDVVVFPTKGPRSLAGKLQGGDYDGDKFWVCWEPSLVQPFKNAPAPDPEHPRFTQKALGIQSHEQKLRDFVPTNEDGTFSEPCVDEWIAFNTARRMGFDQLGNVTLDYGRLIYHDNKLDSDGAAVLLSLHDHLIDADKAGLIFSSEQYNQIRRKYNIKKGTEPAYWYFTKGKKWPRGPPPHNKENIVDYVFFEVLQKKVEETLRLVDRVLSSAQTADNDLTKIYDEEKSRSPPEMYVQRELKRLEGKFETLRELWAEATQQCFRPNGTKPRTWESCVQECRKAYLSIQPDAMQEFKANRWFETIGNLPSRWDRLKASALAKHSHSGKMMFNIAGHELCWLKAVASEHTHLLETRSYLNLKPRKRKAAEVPIGDDEYGDDSRFLEML